jgi:hypothetical protein
VAIDRANLPAAGLMKAKGELRSKGNYLQTQALP